MINTITNISKHQQLHYKFNISLLEWFSIECRKTKTKLVTYQLDFSANLKNGFAQKQKQSHKRGEKCVTQCLGKWIAYKKTGRSTNLALIALMALILFVLSQVQIICLLTPNRSPNHSTKMWKLTRNPSVWMRTQTLWIYLLNEALLASKDNIQ